MKTILHVLRSFENGGTEKYVMNLFRETYKEYNNILLVYNSISFCNEELKKMNIKTITINTPRKEGVLKSINVLRRILKDNKVDILYSYTHYNSAIVMFAGFLERIKIRITHSHRSSSEQKMTIKYRIYRYISRFFINLFTTKKLACSEEAGKDLFYNNFIIVNNGIEIDKYKYSEYKRNKLRQKMNFSIDCKIIGTVGRLDNNKNHLFLLKIFKEYQKKHNESKLLIIGDGENRFILEKYINDNGLKDFVVLTGNRNDVNDLYNVMDIFVLTSIKEGLPFVLIEAQANGLKCVVSDSVDKKSNVTNQVLFLSLKDDVKTWSKIIDSNITVRNDNIDDIIKNGYSLQDSIKIIKKIYED